MTLMMPYTFEIEPSRAALLIVDMQYATGSRTEGLGVLLANAGQLEERKHYFDRIEQIVLPRQQELIAYFREHKLPVLYVQSGSELSDCADAPPHRIDRYRMRHQYPGHREYDILDKIKPLPSDYVVNKTTVSAFASSGLESLLRALNVESLLVCGILTDVCVGLTARNAADRGFKTLLVEDCCAADDETHHRVEIATFGRLFGRAETVANVKEEMDRRYREAEKRL